MLIYRKGKLPCIYSELTWIRVHKNIVLIDSVEEYEHNKYYIDVYNQDKCLSVLFDGSGYLYFAMDIQKEILEFTGNSGNEIKVTEYYHRTYDVLFDLIGNENIPVSVKLSDTALESNSLSQIYDTSSCIELLRDTKTHYYDDVNNTDAVGISDSEITLIKGIEKKCIARYRLNNYSVLKDPTLNKNNRDRRTFSLSKRKRILERDNYKCIFCGADSSLSTIEIDHIIPVSLINKMSLNPLLLDAEFNLCATCFNCNRGKKDNLSSKDINYYISLIENGRLSSDILVYLKRIEELQKS